MKNSRKGINQLLIFCDVSITCYAIWLRKSLWVKDCYIGIYVNTCPLTYIYEEFISTFVLTPAHFLIGSCNNAIPFTTDAKDDTKHLPKADSTQELQIYWKQVDVLYYHLKTRHCVSYTNVNQLLFSVINDAMGKSCEQKLITKEHIAMHTNLILLYKQALHSSTLMIKLFNSSTKLFQAKILTVTL